MSRKSRSRSRGDLGFVIVRVMADYAGSGLWLTYPIGPFRHSGISCAALHLPPELSARFAAWIEAYLGNLEPKRFDTDTFNHTGRELAQMLKAHLGPDTYVEFLPETEEGGLAEPEVIA